EAREAREKHHVRLAKGVKKPLVKLTSAQRKAFGAEGKGELEARTEAWDSYLYWLRPRVYPGNSLDVSALSRAAAARDLLPGLGVGTGRGKSPGIKPAAVPAPTWSTFGPPGYAGGTVTWRVTGLTYDPNDPTHYFCAG